MIPTVRALIHINRTLRNNRNFSEVLNNPTPSLAAGMNRSFHYTQIVTSFSGHWGECIRFSGKISNYFYWYLAGIIFSKFYSIIFWIVRFICGLILTSFGILSSETLSSLTLLKDLAVEIKGLVEQYHIKYQIPNNDTSLNSEQILTPSVDLNEDNDVNPYFLAGLFLIGIFGVIVCYAGVRYFYPEEVDKTMNDVVNLPFSIWDNIYFTNT